MKRTIVIGVLLFVGLVTSIYSFTKTALPTQERVETQETILQQSIPTTYVVEASVDPVKKQVSGKMKVIFTPKDTSQVFFHLYANAFRESRIKSKPLWDQLLGAERKPGGIEVLDVKVQGKTTPFALDGVEGTVLRIPLDKVSDKALGSSLDKVSDKALGNSMNKVSDKVLGNSMNRVSDKTLDNSIVRASDKTLDNSLSKIEVDLSFRLQVPKNSGRMSYDNHTMWLGNWLPIMAVKESGGWRLDPYTPLGDPFYSEVANYQVNVTVPSSYSIATTGYENQAMVNRVSKQRDKVYKVRAENMRDFAMVVVDHTYKKHVAKRNGITVNTWFQTGDNPERVRNLHQTAISSLRYFSNQFGKYPYPEYDVVKTGGTFGGMEYPGIVFIEGNYFDGGISQGAATEVVAHETAHQWFYGLVGNDEFHEPWVDESLATYASLAFIESYDPKLSQHFIIKRKSSGELAGDYAKKGLTVRLPITSYPDMKTYSQLVYSRGSAMLLELKEAWGVAKVNQVFKQYVQQKRYKNATGADVIQAFSTATGADAHPYFDYWLGGDVTKEAKAEAWKRMIFKKSE